MGPRRRDSEALGTKGVKAHRVCMDTKSLPAGLAQGPRLRAEVVVSTWRRRGAVGCDGAPGKKAWAFSFSQAPLRLASISILTPKFQDSYLPPYRRASMSAPQPFLTEGRG